MGPCLALPCLGGQCKMGNALLAMHCGPCIVGHAMLAISSLHVIALPCLALPCLALPCLGGQCNVGNALLAMQEKHIQKTQKNNIYIAKLTRYQMPKTKKHWKHNKKQKQN